MTLKDYLAGLPSQADKDAFAESVGAKHGYLKHVANGVRTASSSLAINIERETGGLVRCEELCPDADWDYIRNSIQNNTAA